MHLCVGISLSASGKKRIDPKPEKLPEIASQSPGFWDRHERPLAGLSSCYGYAASRHVEADIGYYCQRAMGLSFGIRFTETRQHTPYREDFV